MIIRVCLSSLCRKDGAVARGTPSPNCKGGFKTRPDKGGLKRVKTRPDEGAPDRRVYSKGDPMSIFPRCLAWTLFAILAAAVPALAEPVADFYRGKTISLFVGFP